MNVLRRLPVLPTLITAAVLLTGTLSVAPIHDAVTGAEIVEATLDKPLTYVLIAPISGVLDTLTLLSASQHIALLVGLLVLFGAWRALARGGARRHAVATGVFLGAIVLAYAASAYLPRPMAALISDFNSIVRVDFHSHTDASHDGRQSANANRAWHGAAGYDAAYISDHRTVAGAERALLANPSPVGIGITLLQSIETSWNGEHVSIPGAQRSYVGLLDSALANVDTQALRIASFVTGREPIVIWNHPRSMDRLAPATDSTPVGVLAIELVNGAPRDIDFVRRNRDSIVALAQNADIAVVSGSDNHGVGRATPGWTLMAIADWRTATPDELAAAIEAVIRKDGFAATRVVARRVADPGTSTVALAFTAIAAPYRMLTTLSADERISWVLWTWAIFLAWSRLKASAKRQPES